MAIPSYGAHPLSVTFLGVRVLQMVCMVVVLGLSANFVNEMVMDNLEPTKEIVGTLTVTSIVALYTLVSIAFYWAIAYIGLFVMAGVDFLILIAWIVVSVTVGRPVSSLNCYNPDLVGSGMSFVDIINNLNKTGSRLSLDNWSRMSKSNCFETKALWGFSISLAILYATSAVLLPTLWYKNKKVGGYVKHVV